MSKGLFITFEGSEGCGKSTQVTHLAQRLERAGQRVIVTREPGGTAIGDHIRHLLKFDPAGHAMKPETELLLFAASRAQLVRERIVPALSEGTTVIADRFFDSTTVYQGVGRNLDATSVKFINSFAIGGSVTAGGGCVPDITFVIDVDSATARKRIMRRTHATSTPDRMEQEPLEFYESVRQGFLKLALDEPQRVRVIDGSKTVTEVETAIWEQLQARLKA
jgi:dTMP kinase